MSRFDKMREEKKQFPALYTGQKKKPPLSVGLSLVRGGKKPAAADRDYTALAEAIRMMLRDDSKKDG